MSTTDLGNSTDDGKKLDAGNWTDIITALIASVAFVGGLVWVAVSYSPAIAAPALVLAALLGGAVGWGTGILISPYNSQEQSAFGETAKVVYGFLTGFVISKFDPLLTEALRS